MSEKFGQNVLLRYKIEFEKYCSNSKFKAMAPYPFGNLKLPNSGDLIARLGITQLFALENVTQYLFGTKSFYVSIRFPLSVLCMDIRSYPYSNPFGYFRFSHR